LKKISSPELGFMGKISEGIKFLVKSNVYLSIGVIFLTYTNLRIMDLEVRMDLLAIPFFGILSTYLTYQLLNASQLVITNRKKYLFHLEYKNFFWFLVVVSFVAGFYLSYRIGLEELLLFSSVVFFGALYGLSEIGEGGMSRLSLIRAIPASKGIFSALACSTYAVAIPYHSSGSATMLLLPLLFTLCVAYVRSVLHSLRDISGDQVFGREVMPIILGADKTKRMLLGILTFLGIVISYGIMSGIDLAPLAGMIAGAIYLLWFLIFGQKKGWQVSLRFELFLDGQFYIIGFTTLLAGLL